MKLADVSSYAFANLARHKLRTGLTCAGVAVGVATLTVMVSLGSGLERLLTSQFDQAELITRITVLPGGSKGNLFQSLQGGRRGGRAQPGGQAGGQPITDEVIEQLGKIPGVAVAYPDVRSLLVVEANGLIVPAVADALPLAALTGTYQEALLAGSYWTADPGGGEVCVFPSQSLGDLKYSEPEDILGATVVVSHYNNVWAYRPVTEEAPDPADPSGEKKVQITHFERPAGIETRELTVIGVYDSKRFGIAGSFLHVPASVGRVLNKKFGFMGTSADGEYRQAIVKVTDHDQLDAVKEAIERRGFDTQTVFDILWGLRVVFLVFKVMLGFFGGIGLFVAFFGIANTMVMAVLERTREIGVLKAIGARDRDIRRTFVVEAASIGFGGGGVGVLVGWLTGYLLNLLATQLAASSLGGEHIAIFYVEGWLVGVALLLSTLVAAGAGIYPAWRAARLDPVEALRRE